MDLKPLEYHTKLKNRLKENKKTWDWFASAKTEEEEYEKFKTSLLKNTYRLDPEAEPEVYAKIDLAKQALGLNHNVTLYQAQNTIETNAMIHCRPDEVQIVMTGQLMKLLSPDEFFVVIAHELTHAYFNTIENGEYGIAKRIITSIADDPRSEDSFIETCRLFDLYTEVLCDRGSLFVTKDLNLAISSLIKLHTGLDKVSPESYLKQAEEIFSKKNIKAENLTHPENFIRARALSLWQKDGDASLGEIKRMIEGTIDVDKLDIFKQEELTEITKQVISLLLKPKWFQSEDTLALAKQYFKTFALEDAVLDEKFTDEIAALADSTKEYLAYVLLDFALVDTSLEQTPFGLTYRFAEDIGIKDAYDKIVKKEFKYSERKLEEHKRKALEALNEVSESDNEQIYDN